MPNESLRHLAWNNCNVSAILPYLHFTFGGYITAVGIVGTIINIVVVVLLAQWVYLLQFSWKQLFYIRSIIASYKLSSLYFQSNLIHGPDASASEADGYGDGCDEWDFPDGEFNKWTSKHPPFLYTDSCRLIQPTDIAQNIL